MRTSVLALAGVLAAAVSAQDLPASCAAVVATASACSPDSTDLTAIQTTQVAQCICDADANFDTNVLACLDGLGSSVPEEAVSFLEGFKEYCSLFAGGGGGGSAPTSATRGTGSATVTTPTPTPTSDGTDSENCQYIVQGLSSCWTDDSPLPTAAPVASCLCSGTSFDAAIEGCYSDIADSDPKEASTIAAFAGFCSKFSAGAFSPTTTDDSEPTATGGSSSAPTSADEDATSTGRVISTLDPTTTGTGTNSGATGTDTPNSAAGFKVTILGSAIAAILASAALVL
ncbi:hypothetical protein TWF481_008870 [Arthrobotrys musiformis]|uniref:Extracellular membrane protein CFEM domain-containing protein n=1 Tax=Arthrobotrys musiformis TaxID=47236 RepID=A0AAV9WAD0_9PEZI